MDYGRKRDVLRELTANEYNSRPKVNYPDSFASTSSRDEHERMALILKTAEKYQPYVKKK
jgi:hypothetical protein